MTEGQVSEPRFEDTHCLGVGAMVRGKMAEFRAGYVILCCGATYARDATAHR